MFSMRVLILSSLALILLVISVFLIPDPIAPWTEGGIHFDILWQFRLPKSLTALFTGAALAVSGFILQQLFRNNLAGPYILGISSGSTLAVAILIIGSHYFPFLNSSIGISMAGFAGAMAILLLVLSVSIRFGSGAVILLFGVIIGQISGALQGLLNYLAMPGDLKYFTLWSMGSFSQVMGRDLLILGTAAFAGIAWAFTLMPALSVMVLGDDVAATLGVQTKRVSLQLMVCTGLLSGIATAYCGPVAFIGMAIPNASRLLYKTANFRILMLVNALMGACMALLSDVISSLEILGMHIPVNVCTALLGGPFILYILLKKRH